MTRAIVILAYAYRLRRVRQLLAAGRNAEVERVLAALDREHRIPGGAPTRAAGGRP